MQQSRQSWEGGREVEVELQITIILGENGEDAAEDREVEVVVVVLRADGGRADVEQALADVEQALADVEQALADAGVEGAGEDVEGAVTIVAFARQSPRGLEQDGQEAKFVWFLMAVLL